MQCTFFSTRSCLVESPQGCALYLQCSCANVAAAALVLMAHYIHVLSVGIRADEIDILVVTSSVFCPTPSVASMIINMFKMKEDIQVSVWCQHSMLPVNAPTRLQHASQI